MVIIRGNNLHPAAMEELMRGLPDVGEFRCTVRTRGAMNSLDVEVEAAASSQLSGATLARRVAQSIQDRFHFLANVTAVSRGSLPRFDMKSRRFVRSS
jgi:phenylacetate-CoA ligase